MTKRSASHRSSRSSRSSRTSSKRSLSSSTPGIPAPPPPNPPPSLSNLDDLAQHLALYFKGACNDVVVTLLSIAGATKTGVSSVPITVLTIARSNSSSTFAIDQLESLEIIQKTNHLGGSFQLSASSPDVVWSILRNNAEFSTLADEVQENLVNLTSSTLDQSLHLLSREHVELDPVQHWAVYGGIGLVLTSTSTEVVHHAFANHFMTPDFLGYVGIPTAATIASYVLYHRTPAIASRMISQLTVLIRWSVLLPSVPPSAKLVEAFDDDHDNLKMAIDALSNTYRESPVEPLLLMAGLYTVSKAKHPLTLTRDGTMTILTCDGSSVLTPPFTPISSTPSARLDFFASKWYQFGPSKSWFLAWGEESSSTALVHPASATVLPLNLGTRVGPVSVAALNNGRALLVYFFKSTSREGSLNVGVREFDVQGPRADACLSRTSGEWGDSSIPPSEGPALTFGPNNLRRRLTISIGSNSVVVNVSSTGQRVRSLAQSLGGPLTIDAELLQLPPSAKALTSQGPDHVWIQVGNSTYHSRLYLINLERAAHYRRGIEQAASAAAYDTWLERCESATSPVEKFNLAAMLGTHAGLKSVWGYEKELLVKQRRWRISDGATPMHLAAMSTSISLHWLLAQPELLWMVSARTDDGLTPLMFAARTLRHDNVALLLKHSPDSTISAFDIRGWNALVYAVSYADLSQVRQLITIGKMDPRRVTEDGLNALHFAHLRSKSQEARLVSNIINTLKDLIPQAKHPSEFTMDLLSFRTTATAENRRLRLLDGSTLLMWAAAQRGFTSPIKHLRSLSVVGTARDDSQRTALHWCVMHRNSIALKSLVKYPHLPLDAVDKCGATALWYAAATDFEVLEYLGLTQIGLNTPNRAGQTPLWIASKRGHVRAVTALLAAGAQVRIPARDGTTALDVALTNKIRALLGSKP